MQIYIAKITVKYISRTENITVVNGQPSKPVHVSEPVIVRTMEVRNA